MKSTPVVTSNELVLAIGSSFLESSCERRCARRALAARWPRSRARVASAAAAQHLAPHRGESARAAPPTGSAAPAAAGVTKRERVVLAREPHAVRGRDLGREQRQHCDDVRAPGRSRRVSAARAPTSGAGRARSPRSTSRAAAAHGRLAPLGLARSPAARRRRAVRAGGAPQRQEQLAPGARRRNR